jgi:hypothetical protein
VDKKRWHIEGVEGHPWVRWPINATEPYENAVTWRMTAYNQYAASNLGEGAAALLMSEGGDRVGQYSDIHFSKVTDAVLRGGRQQKTTTLLFPR